MLDPYCKASKTCIICSGTWTSISPTYMLQDQNAPRHARQNVQKKVNPQNKNFKTHIILSFPWGPRGQKCKIPIVRSPKPAVFTVEPAPQDHQLTFSKARLPRNPKGQKCKILLRGLQNLHYLQ